MATSSVSAAQKNNRRFVFDLRKPIMTGTMLKQGGFHKAFKERYFVLYPGFLVYYDEQTTWHYDLQRGETLGGRIGAYKLRGGKADKAKQPPKGAKYAFVLHAPDLHNKRHEILLNCQSGEERYQWIHKIESAVPGTAQESPVLNRAAVQEAQKEPVKEKTEKAKEETVACDTDTSEKTEDDVPRPYTPDIDTMLGPIDREPQSMSSDEAASPNSRSLENLSTGGVEMEPASSEQKQEGEVVVSSVTVLVGKEQQVEPEESEKPIEREATVLQEHATEAYIEAQDGPRLSISVVNATEEYTDSSSEDEGLPDVPHPFPIKPEDESSSSPEVLVSPSNVHSSGNSEQVAAKSPTSDSAHEEDGLKAPGTPTFDRRRPTGVQPFEGKKGYMYKMGGRYKTWKLRYFVLMPGQFSYYKNDPKEKALGEVKLKNMKIILPKANEKTFSSFQFTIHTESSWNRRNDYVMAANSERDMKEWIDAFKIAGGLTNINGRSVSPSDSGESPTSS